MVDTQYYIDRQNFIRGPSYDSQYYMNGRYIYGPRNSGQYWLRSGDNEIIGPGGVETGFYVQDNKIYGSSQSLPWTK